MVLARFACRGSGGPSVRWRPASHRGSRTGASQWSVVVEPRWFTISCFASRSLPACAGVAFRCWCGLSRSCGWPAVQVACLEALSRPIRSCAPCTHCGLRREAVRRLCAAWRRAARRCGVANLHSWLAKRRCSINRLTLPSSGRLPACFARFQPPLMSNVRRLFS